MKLFFATGLVLATAALGYAADECCTAASAAAHPLAFIKNANPPAPGAVAGVLAGTAKFEGERPELKPLDVTAEKSVGCVAEGEKVDDRDDSVLIDDQGGLANVVVTISVKGAELVVPEAPIELDQKGCRFDPHVICIPAGATVSFKNSDKVSHNVHTYPKKNAEMNKTIPAGASADSKLEKTDQIQIKCDIHPWMQSWLIVTDTPHVAVTAADGSFSIPDLAPGEYKVEWWHETLGKGEESITVAEDGSVPALEITVGADKKAPRRRR